MDVKRALGIGHDDPRKQRKQLRRYINLKLTALGLPDNGRQKDTEFLDVAHDLLANYREQNRLLADTYAPVDRRIQAFLDDLLQQLPEREHPRLPNHTLTLDYHGLARELSLPPDADTFANSEIKSYRVRQGVLHNPKHDRRTTKGVFHVAEGGLPVPADKKQVPLRTFARILKAALKPPKVLSNLPFTATSDEQAHTWVSLLLRPTVVPEVFGKRHRQSMEIRFFAPGSNVANLDFVESIFGNAGDPMRPENDAALDVDHWTGHTGCVVLATHVRGMNKRALGLPHISDATDRQKREGMCWANEDELYNDGVPFKITARTEAGVIVTVISDNYFGYCKKEVKTQIGFAANMAGLAEEEHAGGALAFPSYNLGDRFHADSHVVKSGQTFAGLVQMYGDMLDVHPDGYATDKSHPSVVYVPEDAHFSRIEGKISWTQLGQARQIPLLSKNVYLYPSGYKVHFEKHPEAPSWRLVGTVSEGVFCHKPSTVSGGGKSEISKSISDATLYGPLFIAEFRADLDRVQALLERDYSDRLLEPLRPDYTQVETRGLLSDRRTLGSVIKLFTPSSEEFTPEYNTWLETIPHHIKALVFAVKRFYQPGWGGDWRSRFSVDRVNGKRGHELRFEGRRLIASYLRVGIADDASWRTFKLRQDYIPAQKVQMEDDISASIVVPADWLKNRNEAYPNKSVKIVENCESRFFQRPDDAIHRGYDKQAEADLSDDNVFLSNFEPLTAETARALVEKEVDFDAWTQPMQDLIRGAATCAEGFVVSSAHPRIYDGTPTKNPRYLQTRPDLVDGRNAYVAQVGARLGRQVPLGEPVMFPVQAVLPGRRNNPADPEAGIRPLAVYNPIHYQELPELFMDFTCSLTGKSPSTTGAGSEGALTKGPFNALRPTADLNNALVGMILTGYNAFSSAAGHIGRNRQVAHDISLLVPELWSRMTFDELEPKRLVGEGALEKLEDFEHNGRQVLASRLGYRITQRFTHTYFGRIFDNPSSVFDEAMLKPETQSLEEYIDGIDNIVEAHQRVAETYFEDGSIAEACPPLKALLQIMAYGHADGMRIDDPKLRNMFTREYLRDSAWYQERLLTKQQRDIELWERHVVSLNDFLNRESHREVAARMGIAARLEKAEKTLKYVRSMTYLNSLVGTIGADPFGGSDKAEEHAASTIWS
jgi:hypothetical protein